MISICIPSHNEERTVGVLLWKIRSVMADFPRDYQLLLVDDASTDATQEILEPYARVLPLTVFRNETRRGYAASLELLLREAVRRSPYPKRDVVVTLQADFTEEPEEIPTLVKRIESGVDVVASSTFDAGETPRGIRWTRTALRPLLRRLGWPENVTDPLSGFRAYRVICLKRALEARNGTPLLSRDGWAANAELLREMVPYARRIEEVQSPITYHRRRRFSRFQPWPTALEVLRLTRVGRSLAPAAAVDYDDDPGELPLEPVLAPPNRAEEHARARSRQPRKRGGGSGADRQKQGERKRRTRAKPQQKSEPAAEAAAAAVPAPDAGSAPGEQPPRKRRSRGGRGRRGGRRRGRGGNGGNGGQSGGGNPAQPGAPAPSAEAGESKGAGEGS